MAGQRVPIRVPRVRGAKGELPLRSYSTLSSRGEVDPVLLKRVLYGISCRNYEQAAQAIPGAIGLSSSSVSRGSWRPAHPGFASFKSATFRARISWCCGLCSDTCLFSEA
jgi:hypothetical protein